MKKRKVVNKLGRPQSIEKLTRITISLSEAEKKALSLQAEAAGKDSISSYVRALVKADTA